MLAALASLLLCAVCWAARIRDVRTVQGTVRGYLSPRPPHYAFLGVPYARPTRHDRFKAPKPPRPWDGIFEATHRVRCRQPDGTGIEDCLVVNVFTPEDAHSAPVLVIVHDGAFQEGWGPVRAPTRLLTQGFVIVTFNYRVGAYGFLCLGVPGAPGNAGLKDQVSALYWVHVNIAKFGGSPYDVTVYGIGAGAASVQFLLMSGSTKGLIHKAVLESGSGLSPVSLSYEPLLTAMDAAIALGYQGSDSPEELVSFYRQIPSKDLVNNTSLFLPCLEQNLHTTHTILDKDPLEALTAGDYQMVPMIIAYTVGIGGTKIKDEIREFADPESFEHMLPSNLQFDNDDIKKKVSQVIKEFYFGKVTLEKDLLRSYIEYISDVTYEYPIAKMAQLYGNTNALPVYFMQFSHNMKLNNDTRPVLHLFDYFYENLVGDDQTVKRLITLWSNFIRIGDPTPLTTFLVPVVWQPIQGIRNNTLNIKMINGISFSKTMQNKNLANERTIFWDHINNKFYRRHTGFNFNAKLDHLEMKINTE